MTEQLGYSTSEDRTMPAVCYALYLLAFATGGLTALVGVIIAYAQRGAAGPTMHSHYTFLIRTFWLGILFAIAGGVVGGVLMGLGALLTIILIGFPIMALAALVWGLTAVWFGVRCILGLVSLSRGDAYPRPYAILA